MGNKVRTIGDSKILQRDLLDFDLLVQHGGGVTCPALCGSVREHQVHSGLELELDSRPASLIGADGLGAQLIEPEKLRWRAKKTSLLNY